MPICQHLPTTGVTIYPTILHAWGLPAQEFLPRLFGRAHIECLVQGNMRAEDALEIAQKARAQFSDGVLTAAERPMDAVMRLPPGCSLLHRWRCCPTRCAASYCCCLIGCCDATYDCQEEAGTQPVQPLHKDAVYFEVGSPKAATC